MAEILIVVDSVSKAEFMKGYFGGRAACVVCGWPLLQTSHQAVPTAPAGLLFQFDALPNGQECIVALDAHRGKEVLLVLDVNARANYLCWQIGGYLRRIGTPPERIKRISPAAFTAEAMEAALDSPAPVDDRQGLEYYGRLLFDECLARHLTRLIGTDRGPGNLPLRQASLATLFLLADREKERQMFQPVVKWRVLAGLQSDDGTGFTAHLAKGLELPADGLIRDVAKARAIREEVTALPFVVDAIHRAPLTIAPPEPMQLAELVHEAKVRLDLAPAATMTTVRRLFHGVAKGGRVTGVISSYSPETDGPSDAMVTALRREVVRRHGASAPMNGPAPGAGAIVPLQPELSAADLAPTLTHEEAALYDLIQARALASQMRPAVGETITIDLKAGKKCVFQAQFHELSEPGFLQADPEAKARIQCPCPLPAIQEGQEFHSTEVRCQEVNGDSRVAERYTIETLFAALADFSIPADPVTITMVDALIRAGYVAISPQGALYPADNAAKIITLLDRAFPRMQGINLSAYIEQTVAEAVSGRKDLPFALKQFDQTLMLHGKTLIKAKITAKIQPRSRPSSTIIKQAPAPPEPSAAAGAPGAPAPPPPHAVEQPPPLEETSPPVVQEEGLAPVPAEEEAATPARDIEPLAAEPASPKEPLQTVATVEGGAEPEGEDEGGAPAPWPNDLQELFSEALSSPPPATTPPSPPVAAEGPMQAAEGPVPTRPCPICGRAMLLKKDTFGAFWGCSGFPGCRYSEAVSVSDQDLACPICSHGLSRKQTPTGKSFYVCGKSDCQFISWSRPHHLPCGLCDSPYLVEKAGRGGKRLRCPRAGCPYEQPLAGGEGEVAPTVGSSAPRKVLVRRATGSGAGGGQTKKVRVVRKR